MFQTWFSYFSPHTTGGLLRVFTLIAVLVPFIISSVFLVRQLELARYDVISHLEETADLRKKLVENWLQNHRNQVRSLSVFPWPADSDAKVIEPVLKAFQQNNPEVCAVTFFNSAGISYDGATTITNSEYFNRIRQGEHIISNVILGSRSKAPVILIGSPVYDDNRTFRGAVYASVKADTIARMMERFRFSNTGETLLIEDTGLVISESRFTQELQRQGIVTGSSELVLRIDSEAQRRATAGQTGSGLFIDYRGEEVFAAYTYINEPRWSIIAKIDEKEIFAPIYQQMAELGLLLLLLLAGGLAMSVYTIRRITIPVKALADGTKEIEQGNYSAVITKQVLASSPSELAKLCSTFNRMGETIKKQVGELAEAEKRQSDIIQSIPDMLVRFDCHGNILEVLSTKGHLVAEEQQAVIVGANISDILPPCISQPLKDRIYMALETGSIITVDYEITLHEETRYREARIVPTDNNEVFIFSRDITDRVNLEQQLTYLSYHDSLTGLYNRTYFENEMHQVEMEETEAVGIIVADVDGLKMVNDALGHEQGDKLLITTANIITDSVAGSQAGVARIGGDEFAVLIRHTSELELQKLVDILQNKTCEWNKDNSGFPIYISTGYSISCDPRMIRDALRQADSIMYINKASKRKKVQKVLMDAIRSMLENKK